MKRAEQIDKYLDDHIHALGLVFYDKESGLQFREFKVFVLVIGEWTEVTDKLSPAKLNALKASFRLALADDADAMHRLVYGEDDYREDIA